MQQALEGWQFFGARTIPPPRRRAGRRSGRTATTATKNSIRRNVHTNNFALFAFGGNLERAATDFAIGCEPLAGNACVDGHFTSLTAVGTLDVGKFFHAAI
jgi:hypothetical protein